MNFTYDLATVNNPVDNVPPLGLSVCQQIYLQLTMLAIVFTPWMTLTITTSALLSLLTYVILIVATVYSYIFCLADGKRVLEYYMAGEFIFKKENTFILALSGLITFISFFALTALFLGQQNTTIYKSYFDESKTSYMALFMCLYVIGLGILEEYYWRNFLIKTLPSGWIPALYVGIHYALLVMMITSSIVEWQYCVLMGVLALIWHMTMVYARKLLKFSSVIVYGIAARLGVYSAFYILFLNIKWV